MLEHNEASDHNVHLRKEPHIMASSTLHRARISAFTALVASEVNININPRAWVRWTGTREQICVEFDVPSRIEWPDRDTTARRAQWAANGFEYWLSLGDLVNGEQTYSLCQKCPTDTATYGMAAWRVYEAQQKLDVTVFENSEAGTKQFLHYRRGVADRRFDLAIRSLWDVYAAKRAAKHAAARSERGALLQAVPVTEGGAA